ncbi:hypothetical protein Zmor_006399 [Zophobas morio]|uniref:Uncharacterized protein n=1 Tax=Zophobas morio TaxID=2755281 RepID=A0AA38MNH1_9CUCU|nr:hypothetical protein Zmor_006399 [Zophobas morio]
MCFTALILASDRGIYVKGLRLALEAGATPLQNITSYFEVFGMNSIIRIFNNIRSPLQWSKQEINQQYTITVAVIASRRKFIRGKTEPSKFRGQTKHPLGCKFRRCIRYGILDTFACYSLQIVGIFGSFYPAISMANNLKELKNQRKILKGMITRIQNSISEQDGIQELEMRLNNLTDSLQKYNDVQAQIEVLQLEDISKDEETWDVENDRERAQVENQFYKTAGQIKSLIIKNNPSSSNSSHKTNSTVINFNSSSSMDRSELIANLKPLPLPIFTETAFHDTAGCNSFASGTVYHCLKAHDYQTGQQVIVAGFADSSTKRMVVNAVKATVKLEGRAIPTIFVELSEEPHTKTLLEIDFTEDTYLILDLKHKNFVFADDPCNKFLKKEPSSRTISGM